MDNHEYFNKDPITPVWQLILSTATDRKPTALLRMNSHRDAPRGLCQKSAIKQINYKNLKQSI